MRRPAHPNRVLLRAAVAALLLCPAVARSQPADGLRWFKGNTHAHTSNSDGDSPPEEVARWYREHGYHFLVLTDHNVLTPIESLNATSDAGRDFLVIKGEELTTRFEDKPLHINGLDVARAIVPREGSSVLDVLQRNVDAIREENGVPHINHPSFGWAITADELGAVQRTRLFEVFNGHPRVNNFGGGGTPSLEEMWDAILSKGTLLYGIAVDDAHYFKELGNPDLPGPGGGWVMVRADRLEPRRLLDALERGDFYATTGVEVAEYSSSPDRVAVSVKATTYSRYRVQFIGLGGRLLSESPNAAAEYVTRGDEGYVRVRILESNGRMAWLQPVLIPPRAQARASSVALILFTLAAVAARAAGVRGKLRTGELAKWNGETARTKPQSRSATATVNQHWNVDTPHLAEHHHSEHVKHDDTRS